MAALNRLMKQILPAPLADLVRMVSGQYQPSQIREYDTRRLYYGLLFLRLSYDEIDMLQSGDELPAAWRYRTFTIPKSDGSLRTIEEPGSALKQRQQTINRQVLQRMNVHPAVMSYVQGRSIANHAWAHAGAELIITVDIQDFFPNTRADRVETFFNSLYRFPPLAEMMTILTTRGGGLPQGAPTSPALSNLVNEALDKKLARRTQQLSGHYTRYADDLAFSFPRSRTRLPADFEHGIRATLQQYGYRMHPHKGWRVYHRSDEPELTGLILTKQGGVRLPDHIQETIKELRKSNDPHDQDRLAGYEGFARMVGC